MNEELLIRFLTRTCTQEELSEVEKWISVDQTNADWLFEMERIWSLKDVLNYSDQKKIEAAYRRFVRATSIERQKQAVIRKMYGSWMKYAAAVAIVCLLAANFYQAFRDKPSEEVAVNTIEVPVGQRAAVTLSDGTRVWLYSGSVLNYPASFDQNNRTVRLDGEGYFEVTHNEKTPFVVQTEHQKITVLGTTFNVMDYSSDDFAVTTVVSGSVEVQPEKQEKAYVLKRNQQVFYDKTTSEVAVTNVKVDSTRSRVDKFYHFRDKSLLEIMQRLAQFYDVKIHIADEALKNEEYSGTFHTGQELDEILDIINIDQQFSYIIENETITITIKP